MAKHAQKFEKKICLKLKSYLNNFYVFNFSPYLVKFLKWLAQLENWRFFKSWALFGFSLFLHSKLLKISKSAQLWSIVWATSIFGLRKWRRSCPPKWAPKLSKLQGPIYLLWFEGKKIFQHISAKPYLYYFSNVTMFEKIFQLENMNSKHSPSVEPKIGRFPEKSAILLLWLGQKRRP